MLLHYIDDLDSKMECMRVMVDRDRLVEGHFTGYSPSMERSILKKAKFMEEPTAPPGSGSAESPRPAAPKPAVPPKPAAPPRPASVFADKLILALTPESGKEG